MHFPIRATSATTSVLNARIFSLWSLQVGKNTNGHIVIIDDDPQMRSLLKDFFESKGLVTSCYALATDALERLTEPGALHSVDLIISDIKMPQLTGLEFVSKLKEHNKSVPIILITAFGTIETAIDAIQRGAYDYVVKPFKLAEVNVTVERALEYRRMHRENEALRKTVKREWELGELLGKSQPMQQVFDLVKRVSKATANVLITGESGTGKEMVAREIHRQGPRQHESFVAINCTAIPESLLESELFGHAKGAFTGAHQRKMGLFEQAHGGTLFLDEIGDLDPSLQAKLLRVLQDKRIRAVGDNTDKEIDVRIIAATHKDLKTAIRENRFREDLYYRLSVIPIVLPPLRHRSEDIPVLAAHFLNKYVAANQTEPKRFSEAAVKKLAKMKFEGNVRELENLIERVVVLTTTPVIEASDIPSPDTIDAEEFFAHGTQDFPALATLEKRYIEIVLEKTGGRKDNAAQILGINRRTLYRKEREYGWINEEKDLSSSADTHA